MILYPSCSSRLGFTSNAYGIALYNCPDHANDFITVTATALKSDLRAFNSECPAKPRLLDSPIPFHVRFEQVVPQDHLDNAKT